MNRNPNHLPLGKSCKDAFPFRIGTTSYIYPDHIVPNVEMLAPYLDEIELVLFQSRDASNLPTTQEIEQLACIGREQGISYNVHLPIDIFLGDPDPAVRDSGVATVQKTVKLTSSLKPSTYTLHLPLAGNDGSNDTNLGQWKKRLLTSMDEILKIGVAPTEISIETLDYPFELIEDILEGFGLSVCLDFGHLLLYGHSVADYAERYLAKTTVVHLHGVRDGKDHVSLGSLGKNEARTICEILNNFSGTVSVEVFSFHDLKNSLSCLEQWCL
ncbi:MAG: sugar phosphate isomerase/epimerase [Desulfobacterales bacterium]|nr:sugar phosphate isomerase/epimerase [Desulfobacterales bacterium]